MTVIDFINKVTNDEDNPQLNMVKQFRDTYLTVVKFFFAQLYLLALLIFIACGISHDIIINIQSSLLGTTSIVFVTDRILLLSGFAVCIFSIYMVETLCIKCITEKFNNMRLKILYGMVTGLEKIKK